VNWTLLSYWTCSSCCVCGCSASGVSFTTNIIFYTLTQPHRASSPMISALILNRVMSRALAPFQSDLTPFPYLLWFLMTQLLYTLPIYIGSTENQDKLTKAPKQYPWTADLHDWTHPCGTVAPLTCVDAQRSLPAMARSYCHIDQLSMRYSDAVTPGHTIQTRPRGPLVVLPLVLSECFGVRMVRLGNFTLDPDLHHLMGSHYYINHWSSSDAVLSPRCKPAIKTCTISQGGQQQLAFILSSQHGT